MAGVALVSCTDKVTFGSEFIDKAPGGTLNLDSIFSNADYINQFLTNIYSKQYYGLPYKHDDFANSHDHYVGKLDAFTDLYQMHWTGARVVNTYYTGNLTDRDWALIAFSGEQVWETVHQVSLIKENIDRYGVLDKHTRDYIVAQATALQAFAYSVLLPHYGGLPIVTHTITAANEEVGPRATFAETVDSIVSWCDQAAPYLHWSYSGNDAETSPLQTGRWTKAGVMALKAQVLWLAASPLFNDNQPYYDGTSQAETDHLVWYGDYQQSRWTRAKQAFDDFWRENEANGEYYHLLQPEKKTSDGYRIAYRRGYIQDDSPENIHWTKTCDYYGTQGTYSWLNWNTWSVNRNNHSPSVEYIEMFPWNDGKPFDHDTDMKRVPASDYTDGNGVEWEVYTCLDGSGSSVNDKLFYTYKAVRGGFNKSTSRDPRLYENARVSGVPESLNYQTMDGASSGNVMELWVGGQQAGSCVKDPTTNVLNENLTSYCPTGFAAYKYVLSQAEYWRDYDMHWNVLTIPDMILMYAEVLAETGDLTGAIEWTDKIRSRVGLKSLKTSSFKIPLSTKDEVIEQILRERACELGMTNARYIDMVRRKRTDWMTKQLHGMATYRMIKNAQNQWVRRNAPWFGDDKNGGMAEPSRFEYEFFELYMPYKRALWEYENDPNNLEVRKWLMSPFPHDEINKGYGLIQNPGW